MLSLFRITDVAAHCDLPCGVYDPAQARIEAESVKAIIAKVNREDLWRTAAKNIGAAESDVPKTTSRGKETFFDGKVFDPEDPKGYLASLQIKKVA